MAKTKGEKSKSLGMRNFTRAGHTTCFQTTAEAEAEEGKYNKTKAYYNIFYVTLKEDRFKTVFILFFLRFRALSPLFFFIHGIQAQYYTSKKHPSPSISHGEPLLISFFACFLCFNFPTKDTLIVRFCSSTNHLLLIENKGLGDYETESNNNNGKHVFYMRHIYFTCNMHFCSKAKQKYNFHNENCRFFMINFPFTAHPSNLALNVVGAFTWFSFVYSRFRSQAFRPVNALACICFGF